MLTANSYYYLLIPLLLQPAAATFGAIDRSIYKLLRRMRNGTSSSMPLLDQRREENSCTTSMRLSKSRALTNNAYCLLQVVNQKNVLFFVMEAVLMVLDENVPTFSLFLSLSLSLSLSLTHTHTHTLAQILDVSCLHLTKPYYCFE